MGAIRNRNVCRNRSRCPSQATADRDLCRQEAMPTRQRFPRVSTTNSPNRNRCDKSDSILDGNPNSCQAEVVSDNAEIFVLSKQVVEEKLRHDPRLAYNMLLQSNRINRMLITQVELMSFRHSEGRVCFYLLHLADQYSEEKNGKKEMYLRYTHQDIAEITGLSRVCVSNIISGLVKDSILTKKDGMYSVVQMDKLQGRINISGIGDE